MVISFTPNLLNHLSPFFQEISKHPIQGYFVFFTLHVLSILLFIPAFIIILAGSLSFAQALGFSTAVPITIMFAYSASLVGCVIAFLLGRTCCQGYAQRWFVERFKVIRAIDLSFITHGKKLVALIRLSGVPFQASNYILGMTRVSLFDYFMGSLAILPNLVVLVVVGSSLNDFSSILNGTYHGSALGKILAIISLTIGVALLIIVVIYARNELKKITEEEQRSQRHQEESNPILSPTSLQ